jgi:hypothetical protein
MDSPFDTTEAIRSWLRDFRGGAVRAYGQGYGDPPQDDHVLLFFDRPDGHESDLAIHAVLRDGRPALAVRRFEGDRATVSAQVATWLQSLRGSD